MIGRPEYRPSGAEIELIAELDHYVHAHALPVPEDSSRFVDTRTDEWIREVSSGYTSFTGQRLVGPFSGMHLGTTLVDHMAGVDDGGTHHAAVRAVHYVAGGPYARLLRRNLSDAEVTTIVPEPDRGEVAYREAWQELKRVLSTDLSIPRRPSEATVTFIRNSLAWRLRQLP